MPTVNDVNETLSPFPVVSPETTPVGPGKSWAFKSLGLNALGSVVDYTVLMVTAGLMLPTPLCTMLGVSAGATFSFLMNRRYAFRASKAALGPQLVRYGAAMGTLMMIHAAVVWTLKARFAIPLLPAKMFADLTVLAASQPFVLKRFVFAPVTVRPVAVAAEVPKAAVVPVVA